MDQGLVFEETLEVTTLPLEKGDLFGFYTDGVTEARNAAGDEYGYDRCLEILQSNRDQSADQIRDALLQDVQYFVGNNNSFGDDLTVVVIKWTGEVTDSSKASGDRTAPLQTNTSV